MREMKRGLDILISSFGLLCFSPVFLVIAILIKKHDDGPVLYTPLRAGFGRKPFKMYKFRTMRVGAENDREFLRHLNEKDGPIFKIANDPRMTWIGGLLRRSSVDELPQLFNVLLGDMSIVGPRPLEMSEAMNTRGAARFRMTVKPGLTCLWQISGRSELSYDTWVSLDLHYIRYRSTILDMLIIFQTIPAVISGHGAY